MTSSKERTSASHFATDVELFEQFPYDYTSYSKRQHRWIRGDWQIASWIWPRVPVGGQPERAPNPLTPINRWKIFDNLRRSLLPAIVIDAPDLQLELFTPLRPPPAFWWPWFFSSLSSFSCCSGWCNDCAGTCAPGAKPAAT